MKAKLLSLLLAVTMILSLSTAFAHEDEKFAYEGFKFVYEEGDFEYEDKDKEFICEDEDLKPAFYCSAEEIAANNNRVPDRFIKSLKYAPDNSAVHFAPDGSVSLEVPENSYSALLDDDMTELSAPASPGSVTDPGIPQVISDKY